MNINNALVCFAFYPKKVLLKVIKRKRFISGKRSRISRSCSIRISGKEALIQMGNHVSIRPNTELHADNRGKIIIGDNVFINRNCMIVSHESIIIGDGTTIGPNTIIYDHDHPVGDKQTYTSNGIKIGKNVWIAGNVSILKGVTIGDNSIVAASSIVTKNVPANSVYIQKRTTEIKPIAFE